jgi:hypothetical protein
MMAMTSRTWMSPPPTWPTKNPNNHKIKKIKNMIQSMFASFLGTEFVRPFLFSLILYRISKKSTRKKGVTSTLLCQYEEGGTGSFGLGSGLVVFAAENGI